MYTGKRLEAKDFLLLFVHREDFDVYRVAPQTWRQGLAGIPGRGNSTEKGGAVFAQIRWI